MMTKTGNIANTNMTIKEELEDIESMARTLDEMLKSKLGAKEWLEKYENLKMGRIPKYPDAFISEEEQKINEE